MPWRWQRADGRCPASACRPLIGSYDEVAATIERLSDAGLDGMALATLNYPQDAPMMRDKLLPRLQRIGAA